MGLDWQAIAPRLEAADGETRARVMDLLEEIEAGAMAADAMRRAESDE